MTAHVATLVSYKHLPKTQGKQRHEKTRLIRCSEEPLSLQTRLVGLNSMGNRLEDALVVECAQAHTRRPTHLTQ